MLGKHTMTFLRAAVFCAVVGALAAKFGWHGLVVGLFGAIILALWGIADNLSDIRRQLPAGVALHDIAADLADIRHELVKEGAHD